jgi:hypothetical protein
VVLELERALERTADRRFVVDHEDTCHAGDSRAYA